MLTAVRTWLLKWLMDLLWRIWIVLLRCCSLASNSHQAISDPEESDIEKLNETVYQLHMPSDGSPIAEIVFVHGFLLEDSTQAYIQSWKSYDDSVYWPKTWLPQRFPRARVLSVSYDSSAIKRQKQGRSDIYNTAETLLHSLELASVGKLCPLILVGHNLGCLVIKQVCIQAKAEDKRQFLTNLKGIFYYSPPHLGLENLDPKFKGELMDSGRVLQKHAARLNEDFRKLRMKWQWKAEAVGPTYESPQREFKVTEASQRHDTDKFTMIGADSITICKPHNTKSSSFVYLTQFVDDILMPIYEALWHSTKLLFENDELYVHLERTESEILEALRSAARVVVLYGGPGTGKTSVAKFVALHLEPRPKNYQEFVSLSSKDTLSFADGVFFLPCGKGVHVTGTSMLRQLLRELGVKIPVDDELLDDHRLRRTLEENLKERHALLVIDDVWDRDIVESLVVPCPGVKYLVTTQKSSSWTGYSCVAIQGLKPESALDLLAKYVGFRDGVVPPNLKSCADALIRATESHPLAIATLSTAIDKKRNTERKEWQEVIDNYLRFLEKVRIKGGGFGSTYSLTVQSSMMVAVESLPPDMKDLLCIIALFEGPRVPESVVQLVVKYTQPPESYGDYTLGRKYLQDLTLLQLEDESIFKNNAGSESVLSMHGLRQYFILNMKPGDMGRLTGFLENDVKPVSNLARLLCAVYAVEEVRGRAIKQLCQTGNWCDVEISWEIRVVLRPLLSLMLAEEDKKPGYQCESATAQMVWNFVTRGKVDDSNASSLLDRPRSAEATCNFLCAVAELSHRTWDPLHVSDMPRSLQGLVGLMSNNVQDTRVSAAAALQGLARENKENQLHILEFPGALEGLVALLSMDFSEKERVAAAGALAHLGSSVQNRVCIVKFPGALERLCALLSTDCSEEAQMWAARTFSILAIGTEELCIGEISGALEGLVRLLSKDCEEARVSAARALQNLATGNEENRLHIGEFPGAVEGLVALLSRDFSEKGRVVAAGALAYVCASPRNCVCIVKFPGALERLGALLSTDCSQEAQMQAAVTFSNLAIGTEELCIGEISGALEGLVRLLSNDCDEARESAAGALRNLATGNEENRLHIGKFPGALEGLVALLSRDISEKGPATAAGALASLCLSPHNCVCIGEFPGVLEGLVGLLSRDFSEEGRVNAAGALANLCGSPHNCVCIVKFPGALERLGALLSTDCSEEAQMWAALTFSNLASGTEELRIAECSGALEGLVRLLSKDCEEARVSAARALRNLATGNEENRLHIGEFPGALEGLVALLSRDFSEKGRVIAAGALAWLCGSPQNRVCIVKFPGALERLGALLSTDCSEEAQMQAAETFSRLAIGTEELCIGEISGALEGLVRLLSKDCEKARVSAARALRSLASGNEENRLHIGEFPGALEGLVALLSRDFSEEGRGIAAGALANLCRSPHNCVCIREIPGALEGLVALLSTDFSEKGRVFAARALACLCGSPQSRGGIVKLPGPSTEARGVVVLRL